MPDNRNHRMPDRTPATDRPPALPAIAFAGATLDRAAHLRDDADRLRDRDTSRAVLVGRDQEVALTADGTLALSPTAALPAESPLTFLGLDPSGAAIFAGDALDRGAPQTSEFVSLRALAAELDTADAALAAYAVGMANWHRVTRYCGRSGHATVVEAGGHRRRCPGCGLLHFPRTDPVVTMLVQTENRCLLSRRLGSPEHRWSALAGFMEPGETPEEAVVREAQEETGVTVQAVEYVTSQPWPFPSALMIGFWAFADPDDETSPTAEPGELVEVRWWERSRLAGALEDGRIILPPAGSIGNYLISTWLAAQSADAG
jgi:NAD+ diphosphatase